MPWSDFKRAESMNQPRQMGFALGVDQPDDRGWIAESFPEALGDEYS